MTTKILTGVYGAAYSLGAPITTLSIAASGYIAGGVTAVSSGTYTLVNYGEVTAAGDAIELSGKGVVTNAGTISDTSTAAGAGVILGNGGTVSNLAHAVISGYYGVKNATQAGAVTNLGLINATGKYGVVLTAGGVVTNGATASTGALIRGQEAVVIGLPGTLNNFGTIIGTGTLGVGAYLKSGGVVTNGATNTTAAILEGSSFGLAAMSPAAVHNFGTIAGLGTSAVGGYLKAGGVVINGAPGDAAATISGVAGGLEAATAVATLTNYGLVAASGTSGIGVAFLAGGVITNGSAADTGARISGAVGAAIEHQLGTVRNFGTIIGTSAYGAGAYLTGGGSVANGSAADTTALIDGNWGVAANHAVATVTNFGTLGGATAVAGVILLYGGLTTNGSTTDTTALIEGYVGVGGSVNPTTVNNFGTILASGGVLPSSTIKAGVYLTGGGRVTNGGTSNPTALLSGAQGVYAKTAAATVTNFATILGSADGVALLEGGAVTNGSASDKSAVIQGGAFGVGAAGAVTSVTNFGTILAASAVGIGVALEFDGAFTNGSATDTSAYVHAFQGALLSKNDKATNWGTIAGDKLAGSFGVGVGYKGVFTNKAGALVTGNIGVYAGSLATVMNFGVIANQGGPAVMLSASTAVFDAEAGSLVQGVVAAGSGTVSAVGGVATMSGLTTAGKVTGAGTVQLNGGASLFSAGASLTVAGVTVAGAATAVEVAAKLSYAKVWSQGAGTLTIDAGDQMTFTGSGDSFSGVVTGAGEFLLSGGSDTLSAVTLSAATMVVKGSALTLSGAIGLTKTLTVTSTAVTVAAGGATLSGGGSLNLSNNATNLVKSATGSATFTNAGDRITGAGNIGGGIMTLVNQAGGVINGNQTTGLTIDTGANTITNAGVIESTSTGGVTIASAIANSGQLTVNKGALLLEAAVTGAGVVRIGGGVADVATASFTENVTFTSTTGVLELANSLGYTGKVTGFSKAGTTSFDLLDIAYIGGTTTASYSGTTASGVLTVTDGVHTAKITLAGDFTSSTFNVSSDGHGGTTVVDPTAPPPHTPPVQPLVSAMAGFAAGAGAAGGTAWSREAPRAMALVRPA